MYELKRIGAGAVPAAVERAHRYRLLNEPREAESICRDVLEVAPDHQEALVTLLLALTDQFVSDLREARIEAKGLLPKLPSEHDRAYYAGVIAERAAKALLAMHYAAPTVFESLREALGFYERAMALSTAAEGDAVLRWNACVRMIRRHGLEPDDAAHDMSPELQSFEDEMPNR